MTLIRSYVRSSFHPNPAGPPLRPFRYSTKFSRGGGQASHRSAVHPIPECCPSHPRCAKPPAQALRRHSSAAISEAAMLSARPLAPHPHLPAWRAVIVDQSRLHRWHRPPRRGRYAPARGCCSTGTASRCCPGSALPVRRCSNRQSRSRARQSRYCRLSFRAASAWAVATGARPDCWSLPPCLKGSACPSSPVSPECLISWVSPR